MNHKLYRLRPVKDTDKNLLFEWANDCEVRNNSFNQEQISWTDHNNWFDKAINDKDISIYILMEDEEPIGQCRIDVDEHGYAEIDYSITESRRGEGLGNLIIDLLIDEVYKKQNIKKLIGKVRSQNNASMRCFESNGFTDSYHVYELQL